RYVTHPKPPAITSTSTMSPRTVRRNGPRRALGFGSGETAGGIRRSRGRRQSILHLQIGPPLSQLIDGRLGSLGESQVDRIAVESSQSIDSGVGELRRRKRERLKLLQSLQLREAGVSNARAIEPQALQG